jgi:hypothetical protein
VTQIGALRHEQQSNCVATLFLKAAASIDQSKAENMQWRAIGKLKIVLGIFISPLKEGQEMSLCSRRCHVRPSAY